MTCQKAKMEVSKEKFKYFEFLGFKSNKNIHTTDIKKLKNTKKKLPFLH